jgi:hypothetical protein
MEIARDGRVPAVRIGGPTGPLRFVEEDVERWLDEARTAWRPGDRPATTLRRRFRVAGRAKRSV